MSLQRKDHGFADNRMIGIDWILYNSIVDSDSQPSRKKIRRRPRKIKKMDTNNNSETQLVPSHIQGMKRARPEYKDQDEETNEEPKYVNI